MDTFLVIGSMNMDLVFKTPEVPEKGETILGSSFQQIPGGKGANQAAAIGKLGGKVEFIGACGQDDYGDFLLHSLTQKGVITNNVFRIEENTGIAGIIVEADGDNRIIVVQGANSSLSTKMIAQIEEKIKNAGYLLLQMEIPLKTIIYCIELACYHQTRVILDPAPAQKLPEEIYSNIDFLLPNKGELELLLEEYNSEEERV